MRVNDLSTLGDYAILSNNLGQEFDQEYSVLYLHNFHVPDSALLAH
jgi:hypothetical protein